MGIETVAVIALEALAAEGVAAAGATMAAGAGAAAGGIGAAGAIGGGLAAGTAATVGAGLGLGELAAAGAVAGGLLSDSASAAAAMGGAAGEAAGGLTIGQAAGEVGGGSLFDLLPKSFMGQVAQGAGSAVASNIIQGLMAPKLPQAPSTKKPTAMPDPMAQSAAQRKRLASFYGQQLTRANTILTGGSDRLGS